MIRNIMKIDSFKTRAAVRGAVIAVVAMIVCAAGDARAQSTATGVPNAMQGFSQNRDKPIQINAATLEMRDKDKAATFSGNVKVVQGDTTMLCKTLVVFYDNDQSDPKKPAMKSSTPGPGGSSSIRKLEAKGGVTVTQKDSTVTGDRGVFDMRANTVTMFGNVLLTKEKNVLRGDRLVVDHHRRVPCRIGWPARRVGNLPGVAQQAGRRFGRRAIVIERARKAAQAQWFAEGIEAQWLNRLL